MATLVWAMAPGGGPIYLTDVSTFDDSPYLRPNGHPYAVPQGFDHDLTMRIRRTLEQEATQQLETKAGSQSKPTSRACTRPTDFRAENPILIPDEILPTAQIPESSTEDLQEIVKCVAQGFDNERDHYEQEIHDLKEALASNKREQEAEYESERQQLLEHLQSELATSADKDEQIEKLENANYALISSLAEANARHRTSRTRRHPESVELVQANNTVAAMREKVYNCFICTTRVADMVAPYGHHFCEECVVNWVESGMDNCETCPHCRKPFARDWTGEVKLIKLRKN